MPGRATLALAVIALTAPLRVLAELEPNPEAEALAPPTPARLAALATAGAKDNWAGVDAVARAAATTAYARAKPNAAEGWHYVHRWAALFDETQAQFVVNWIPAVEAAKVAHANMARSYAGTDRRLGELLAPDLKKWFLDNAAFSDEF